MEVARLIEDLTVSHQAGWYSVISLHGGGSPEAMKREIWRNYPVGERNALVEDLLDRGVLADGRRLEAAGPLLFDGLRISEAGRRGGVRERRPLSSLEAGKAH